MLQSVKIVNIFLCGGSGKRLWPLSRSEYPKQFLKLFNGESLLVNTIKRNESLNKIYDHLKPIVVTNINYRYILNNEFISSGLKNKNFDMIFEPVSKNTAPAIFSAIAHLNSKNNTDVIVIVSPTDHNFQNISSFKKTLKIAIQDANKGFISAIGVEPSRPETGYGYIKIRNSIEKNLPSYDIECFTEKPNLKNAKNFFKSNSYFWNSGIFVFKLSVINEYLLKYSEKLFKLTTQSYLNCTKNKNNFFLDRDIYSNLNAISFDYEFMEKISNNLIKAKLAPLYQSGWSDLGSHDALIELNKKDNNNNSISGDVITNMSRDNLVISDDKLVVLSNVNDLQIFNMRDVLLIKSKDKDKDNESIIKILKNKKREELNLNTKIHRPWGWYDVLDFDKNHKVKRICVYPKQSLSLQSHKKRSEHWVVIKGKAKVFNHDNEKILKTNESLFIRKGSKHRLSNPFNIDLEIIEVQTGTYLNEDDIVRFDDKYDRND